MVYSQYDRGEEWKREDQHRATRSVVQRLVRRVWLFSRIVWRPVSGPNRDEDPVGWLRCWWTYKLDHKTAWDACKIIHE